MPKQKSHEEFINELKIKRPDIKVLGKYVNSTTKVKVVHNCGYVWDTLPFTIINGKSCPICGKTIKKTQEQFEKELFQINNKIKVVGEYISNNHNIKCICLLCNNVFSAKPSNLLRNHGCPYCSGRKTSIDTCIINTHPYIKNYLFDINDGYKYSFGSHKHIRFKCPDCGNVRQLEIKSVISQGFSCTICSDGLSYPNKFARAFLSQLPIANLIHEYSPLWAGRYSYDNYFIYNKKQYILEMDGEFHYKSQQLGNHTLENQIEIDKIKDSLAEQNDICMIRIDCKIPKMEYIKNHILNSMLSNLFDLKNIDWARCEKFAVKNLAREVCEYYQNNKKDLTLDKLGEIFSISSFTASNYVKIGKQVGWIKNDIDESLLRSYQIKNPKSKKLSVFNPNGYKIYEFKSMNLCAKQMSIDTGCVFLSSSIRYAIKHKKGKYKNYIFQYI